MDAKRKRKRILEKIRDAREMVRWSNVCNEWEAVFIARVELNAEIGDSDAKEMWNKECFHPEVKESSDLPKPCTKAEAFAAWTNCGYLWTSCRTKWNQLPRSALELKVIDSMSRERIKARLQELVP